VWVMGCFVVRLSNLQVNEESLSRCQQGQSFMAKSTSSCTASRLLWLEMALERSYVSSTSKGTTWSKSFPYPEDSGLIRRSCSSSSSTAMDGDDSASSRPRPTASPSQEDRKRRQLGGRLGSSRQSVAIGRMLVVHSLAPSKYLEISPGHRQLKADKSHPMLPDALKDKSWYQY